MKKIVRLTESDLHRIVKRVIKENDESMGDMGPISQFTPSELMDIKDNVIRYSQPGFFEDNEAGIYLFYTVANGDQSLYDSLVDWLGRNGVDTYLL